MAIMSAICANDWLWLAKATARFAFFTLRCYSGLKLCRALLILYMAEFFG